MEKYEKNSETELKIITSVEEAVSLSNLKKDLEEATLARENLVKDHAEKLLEIDTFISKTQVRIGEALKLDIKEEKLDVLSESIENIPVKK